MMRKIAIGLAAALITTGGATLTAAAHRGGFYGGLYSHGGRYMTAGPRGEYGYRYGYRWRPEWRHHRYWGPRRGYYDRRYGGYGYARPYGAYGYYRGGWSGHHMLGRPGRRY